MSGFTEFASFSAFVESGLKCKVVSLRGCTIPDATHFVDHDNIMFFDCAFEGPVQFSCASVSMLKSTTEVHIVDSRVSLLKFMMADEPLPIRVSNTPVSTLVLCSEFKNSKIVYPLFDDYSVVKKLSLTGHLGGTDHNQPLEIPEIPFYTAENITITCWKMARVVPQLAEFNFTLREYAPLTARLCNLRDASDADARRFYSGQVTLEELEAFYAAARRYTNRSIFNSNQTVHIEGLEGCFKKESEKMLTEYRQMRDGTEVESTVPDALLSEKDGKYYRKMFSPSAWLQSLKIDKDVYTALMSPTDPRAEVQMNIMAAVYKAYLHMQPKYHLDWIARLHQENVDGYGMCVPGRIGRVINSFVAFFDHEGNEMVTVELSQSESLSNLAILLTRQNAGKGEDEIKKIIFDEIISRGYSEDLARTWSA